MDKQYYAYEGLIKRVAHENGTTRIEYTHRAGEPLRMLEVPYYQNAYLPGDIIQFHLFEPDKRMSIAPPLKPGDSIKVSDT